MSTSERERTFGAPSTTPTLFPVTTTPLDAASLHRYWTRAPLLPSW
ncbi:MAG: hypothetical protein GY820_03195 [Gammaproteobacteria bacterium]|nr:hypothetical protein [Gammaproteobacteria bacterium]